MEIINEAGIQGIAAEDFVAVNRITPAGQSQFLLARMRTPSLKAKIYSQRTKFKQCMARIYVNEDLTREDAAIFKKARMRVKEGILHSCWSMEGIIFGKASPEGKPFQIKEL